MSSMNVVCKNHEQAGLALNFRNERPNLDSVPIVAASELTVEYFQEAFVRKNVPVVVKDALTEEWTCMRSWDTTYLKTIVGHSEIPIRVHPQKNGTFGSVKKFQEGNLSLYTTEMLPFETFLSHVEDTPSEYYAARVELVNDLPELVPDIPIFYDISWRFAFGAPYKNGPIVYFGPGNQSTPLHYDTMENLTFMVSGIKHFRLYPPSESHYLYPCDRNLGTHYSLADNETDFPTMQQAMHLDVELHPGDMLYLPVCWWHFVHGGEGHNISLNYWMHQHPEKEDYVSYEKYLRASFSGTLGQLETMNLPQSVLDEAKKDAQSTIAGKIQFKKNHNWNITM